MEWLKLFSGLVALIWSADQLVEQASKLAFRLGVKPLVIGLTIIGFGTSAPEIFISLFSSLSGNEDIAIGNAIGSNIANIGLVIGFCSLLKPLPAPSETIKNEMIALLIITFLVYGSIVAFGLPIWFGLMLLTILISFLIWLIYNSKNNQMLHGDSDYSKNHESIYKIILKLFVSLVILSLGADFLVEGGAQIAQNFGVSETFIGLTLVALGTSLPELAVSIIGIIKKHHSIALGNIIGSNVFNLTAVLAPVALISPKDKVSWLVITRDFPVMLGLTLLFCLPFLLVKNSTLGIGRLRGTFLVTIYIGYITLLVGTAT